MDLKCKAPVWQGVKVKAKPCGKCENCRLLEQLAEMDHLAWMKEKTQQGYHYPTNCPFKGRHGQKCSKCHKQMVDYKDLSEDMKELNRIRWISVEDCLKPLGYVLIKDDEIAIMRQALLDADHKYLDFKETATADIKAAKEEIRKLTDEVKALTRQLDDATTPGRN